MSKADTLSIAPVDARILERAYVACAHLFEDRHVDDSVFATEILHALEATLPKLNRDEIVDVFRRLCLTIQLVCDIDANWEDSGYSGERPASLPSALYQFAGSETAFEEVDDTQASLFFAREVLDDVFSILRPN